MGSNNITGLAIAATLIFLLAPAFIVGYILTYNRRKAKFAKDKENLRLGYESELINTQLAIREQTMQTVGSDLHDNIGQILNLIALTLGSIENTSNPKEQIKINTARELTGRSIDELHHLGKLIQGQRLIDISLAEAINQEIGYLERMAKFRSIHLSIESLQAAKESISEKDLVIFRIIQELINNILKHSGADEMTLSVNLSGQKMRLLVSDNGKGFQHADGGQKKGMGMYNIHKRVAILGGDINIESAPGNGTTVKIMIPYVDSVQES